jgi:hypothetical protein
MSIGNKSLNLPISDFSQEIIYFYIPMLTVFINAVRYYFIDSQYVSKRFYIDND